MNTLDLAELLLDQLHLVSPNYKDMIQDICLKVIRSENITEKQRNALNNAYAKLKDEEEKYGDWGYVKKDALSIAIEALEKIANEDFRGNRPHSATIAYKALQKIKKELK